MRFRAPICIVAVLAALAGAGWLALAAEPAGPVIEVDGTVEATEVEPMVCNVELRYHFPVPIAELVPEWSFVEKGQFVARLESPLIDVEKLGREADLAVAEAGVETALAGAASSLAKAQADAGSAESLKQAAEQRLAAARAKPLALEDKKLGLEVEANALELSFAAARLDLLAALRTLGLCSDFEMTSAQHDFAKQQADAERLAALTAELKPGEKPLAVRLADAELRQAELNAQAARLRHDTEVERQRLLCDAARCGDLQHAQRLLDLTNRKIEAMTMRAPRSGFVVYGRAMGGGTLSQGKPAWFGIPVVYLVDAAQLRVRASVGEHDVPRLHVGDAVVVRFRTVPGRTYSGKIAAVLATITGRQEGAPGAPAQAGAELFGTVLIALTDADAAVRPGMTARLAITPAGRPTGEESGQAAGPDAGLQGALYLRGQLDSRSYSLVGSPMSGRVQWVAEKGAQVSPGDPVARIDAGLEEDWRQADESNAKRLDLLKQAAQLSVQLQDELAPLIRGAAEDEVAAAELKLEALKQHPLASEKLKAKNARLDAQWQCDQALAKRDIFRGLAARGMASGADAARYELQAAVSQAHADIAQVELERTLRGASAPELAVAQAELDLARIHLETAPAAAEQDDAVARAELAAADTTLDTFKAQAERRRQKAESSVVKSPVQGVVVEPWVLTGNQANKGWPLMRIAESSRPVAHAVLNECDLLKVSAGMPAMVELAGVPSRAFAGRVAAVEDWPELPWYYRQQQQDQSKTMTGKLFQVVIELTDEPPLYMGMSARVRITGVKEPARHG